MIRVVAISLILCSCLASAGEARTRRAVVSDGFGAAMAPGCNGQRVMSAYYTRGVRTASGDRFNPHGLTAAHRSLPFGSQLTVANPRNGRSVTVTVNDRGPFVRGIGLDLSLGAARAIGMTSTQMLCLL